MLWACVLLPHRPLDTLRRLRRATAPLAVVEGAPPRAWILEADDAAQRAGVHPGQALTAALALLPTLEARPRDRQAEQQLQQLLGAWAYRSSPQVRFEDDGAVLIEIGASLALLGPWPALARRWRSELAELSLQHRLAVAPTPLGARVLAAARDGLAVRDPQPFHRLLQDVPLIVLPLEAALIERLHGVGLQRLGDLLALPRMAIGKRYGVELLGWITRLLGEVPDIQPLYQPPSRFEAHADLGSEVVSTEALVFPLRRLVDDLAAFLMQRSGGVQEFTLGLRHARDAWTRIPISLRSPTREAAQLFEYARARMGRTALPAPVRLLSLEAENLPPFIPLADDLFERRPGEALDWPTLCERLRARLGDAALYQWQPVADARPEHAQRRVAQVLDEGNAPDRPRPLWLLPQPLPLREGIEAFLAGPERIEAGWWDGGEVRRDYYVVRTTQGQRAWVFTPAGQRGPWLLHGWFA